MCNCKGWDIVYFPDHISVEQHFCRLVDDCGHVDNTLEQAADEVAAAYDREHDWCVNAMNRDIVEHSPEHLDNLRTQAELWRNRTHPDYIFYTQDHSDEQTTV
jgi:hypothetical protein